MKKMSVIRSQEELRDLRTWLATRLAGMPARAAKCETMEASAKIGDEAFKFEHWIQALDLFLPTDAETAAAPADPEDSDDMDDLEGDERMWGYDGDALR